MQRVGPQRVKKMTNGIADRLTSSAAVEGTLVTPFSAQINKWVLLVPGLQEHNISFLSPAPSVLGQGGVSTMQVVTLSRDLHRGALAMTLRFFPLPQNRKVSSEQKNWQ